MFKSFYTTRMSDDGKVLKRRFKNLVSGTSKNSKIATIICVIALIMVIVGGSVALSRVGDENNGVALNLEVENSEDVTLTIYYSGPSPALKNYPWSIENLKKFCKTKIVVTSDELKEHENLLEKIKNVSLQPIDDDSYLDCNVYYILESSVGDNLLDVAMSTSSGCLIVNGEKVRANYDLMKVITPFLPDEDSIIWSAYISTLSNESPGNVSEENIVGDPINCGIDILCNGKSVALLNKPFYYYGDIYVPIEELFERISAMTFSLTNFVEYDGNKILFTYQDENGKMREFNMEIGKKYIDGDNEFMPVTAPFNAPVVYNEIVYIPMEYVHSMFFYETVIDYRLTGEHELIEKINDAVKFEKELRKKGTTQYELNINSFDVYRNWDNLLNEVMEKLTEEELSEIDHPMWVKTRENYMENEALPNEGGSMQPMVHAYAGAHITRKRCEKLIVEYILN